MIYQDDKFPILTTSRIIVSATDSSKVKVEFLLKSRENQSLSSWGSSEEYSQYMRIHFFVLDDFTASSLPLLIDPTIRYETINELSQVAPHVSLPFSEVLRDEFFVTTPASDMSGDYYHDIYGEVFIDTPRYMDTNNEKVHLISFIHLDVKTYMEDQGISLPASDINPLQSIGSGLVYDLLLERGEDQKLQVPISREIFYIKGSMESYTGPVHYHGPDNPGPSGYVGWMAGHGPGLMGPELESRRIRNYKIVSDIYSSDNIGLPSSISQRPGYANSPTGESLDTFLRSTLTREELIDESIKMQSLVNASRYAEARKSINVIDYGSGDTSHINVIYDPNNPSGDPLQQSHYGCVIGIDFLNLLKNSSEFGDILDFHAQRENDNFITKALLDSRIERMSLIRQRVTNRPQDPGIVGTLEYVKYDNDEPDKVLIHASDKQSQTLMMTSIDPSRLKGRLIAAASPLASVEEVDILQVAELPGGSVVTYTGPKYSRQFVLRDRDLFHNVSFGKYTYLLDITIVDGTRTMMSNMSSTLYRRISDFQKYFNQASLPVLRENGRYVQGSFDYDLNRFHEKFIEIDFSRVIENISDSYLEVVYFLTGKKPRPRDREELINSLSAQKSNLEILHTFLEVSREACIQVTKILQQSSSPGQLTDFIKTGKTNPASSSGLDSGRVNTVTKTGIFVDAFSETKVMADFSIREVHPPYESSPNLSRAFAAADLQGPIVSMEPRRFITVSPSMFQENSTVPIHMPDSQSQTDDSNYTLLSNGSVMEISNNSEYNSSTSQARSSLDIKINALRLPDSDLAGLIAKGDSHFPYLIQSLSGVIIGPSDSMTVRSDAVELQSGLVDPESAPDASAALRTAICESAYKGDDRDAFINSVSNNFRDLLMTRESLGQLYDSVYATISAASVAINNQSSIDLRGRYLTGPSARSTNPSDLLESSFTRESSLVIATGPSQIETQIDMRGILNSSRVSTRNSKKYVFLKLKNLKQDDNIIPVNNAYLIEV